MNNQVFLDSFSQESGLIWSPLWKYKRRLPSMDQPMDILHHSASAAKKIALCGSFTANVNVQTPSTAFPT